MKPGTGNWMKQSFNTISKGFIRVIGYLIPSRAGWKGAAYGLIVIICLQLLVTGAFYLKTLGLPVTGLYLMKYLLQGFLTGIAVMAIVFIYRLIPGYYWWVLFGSLAVLLDFWPVSNTGKFAISAFTVLSASFFTGALYVLRKNRKNAVLVNRLINIGFLSQGLAGLIFGGIFIFREGVKTDIQENAALKSTYRPVHISLENPSLPGKYQVLTMTYGNGKDKHRKEFGEEADIRTDSVDGSRFVSGWDKFNGWVKTRYWGFDEKSLPLNARVWYPDTTGPFPLVLIVHGNHYERHFSDPGYEYLGMLMASRGFIFASVDENFLNGSWADIFKSLEEENDCRGWLLLKHIELWHRWNKEQGNIFFSKVDTGNIALIGHSRGGEAVAIAACFNQLPYYPDDATVKFNFGFGIRSVVAIAPVDGQYMPSETGTRFSNVNYFVLQGSNDMDMQSYHGARQFQRICFNDNAWHFKAGLYIFGANHGQFNSQWGINDVGYPGIAIYNRKQIMPEEDQETIGKVFVSAFLESTLHHQTGYVRLFQDYRAGIDWLPETIYLNQFEDTYCKFICTYQEDIDLSTTTQKGGHTSMDNLTVWKEMTVPLKWGSQDTRSVYLGWNQEEKDSLTASYTITQSPSEYIVTDSCSCLYFVLADANEDSNPYPAEDKDNEKGTTGNTNSGKETSHSEEKENNQADNNNMERDDIENNEENGTRKEKDEGDDEQREPIDFSLQISDTTGQESCLLLSEIAFLQPQIESKLMKADFMTETVNSEIVFRNYAVPLTMFKKVNPLVDISCVRSVQLIFDRTKDGVVILDNAGFWKPCSTIDY